MPLPRIAIVGRPNVGKSSLLNRLARRRVSIVDAEPGVTRDRVSAVIELSAPVERPGDAPGRMVELIDTGGYGVYTAEGKRFDDVGADLTRLTPDIESQIEAAMTESDVILFVTDAQSGLSALDQSIAGILRRLGVSAKVLPVSNKVDGEQLAGAAMEAAGLGFGAPQAVSATTGFGMRQLREAIHDRISALPTGDAPAGGAPGAPGDAGDMKIAIVGKRNSGKSTLINALAGEQRVIVSEIAGTTRDSIDVRFEIDGRAMLAIDTAGLRKRKSFADDVEFYAYHRMLGAIRRADVAALLIDATVEISQVDKTLAQELRRQYKPTLIVVNKWDLVDTRKTGPKDYLAYLTEQLRGLEYAPIVFVSAAKGDGLREMAAMAFNLHEQAGHRETTGRLNTIIRDILKKRGPSSKLGTIAKLLYVSQVATNPPTIALVVNDPKLFDGQYERYLLNELRDALPFSEVPIRLIFSKRKRMELGELKARGRVRAAAEQSE